MLIPLVVGLLAAVAVALYPSADEPGSTRTGPVGLAHLPRVVLPFAPTVSWGRGRTSVILTVHPRRPCSVTLTSVTSTAPGRIEALVAVRGQHCRGSRTAIRFRLPLPTLPDPHKNVRVEVGDEQLRLPWSVHPIPHPPGSYV